MRSVALVVCCGRDEHEVTRRAGAVGRDVAELKVNGLAGSPSEVLEKIEQFAQLGVTRVYLQVLDFDDLDHVGLLSSEVQSALR